MLLFLLVINIFLNQPPLINKKVQKSYVVFEGKKINYDTLFKVHVNIYAIGIGGGKFRFLNQEKQKISDIYGCWGDTFKEGILPVMSSKTGDLGLLDENLDEIVPCNLTGVSYFEGGLIQIVRYGEPGVDYRYQLPLSEYNVLGRNPLNKRDNYLNHQFELMIPKYYDSIVPYRDGKIRMVMKKALFGFLDTTGREVVAPTLTDFDADNQYSWQHLRRVQHKGLFGFVDDRNGQQIIPFAYEATVASTYPFTWVRKAGKWGCINQAGVVLIPFLYDNVSYFDADSISLAGLNGRMGHIRANGSIVTPLLYESAQPFAEGLALVSQEGRYGYVNQKGQLIIPAVYTRAASFRHGHAHVERFGIKATIDKQGHWVNYRLGTGWNLSIVLFFLMLVLFVAYRRRAF
ncbi:WG containing repeat-containing protein [Spirosoma fluviale]|uniref:WG containing repeat-containing protein n=2 Tax=Spirosoma fluviale TaxID=1597977 RepID=A0A286GAW4_9BACT|nr:WG containing repeat-containing protein [Spirosoma fluviale]